MTDQEAIALLMRFKAGECTPEEELSLYNYYDELDRSSIELAAWIPDEEIRQQVWQKLQSERMNRQPEVRQRRLYWPMAAAVALVLTAGAWYITLQPKAVKDVYAFNKEHDRPAGRDKAVLTLANGQQITLDSATAGTIAVQAGVTITQSSNGQLVYTVGHTADVSGNLATAFNTISTPNGGQYKVVLPDSTQVWLNAASRLKYPVKFNGDERKVTLNGEAYFEVAKNPERPFIVNAGNQVVKVLGTHFNINSYADEQEIKTTLAEGKVLVTLVDANNLPLKHHFTLRPGQQAISTTNSLKVKEVNADEATAWKDGLFVFSQSSIKQVMQQVSRWYDVDVDYNELPEKRFDGEISRDIPLSDLLMAIEKTNQITFLIEGRKITLKK